MGSAPSKPEAVARSDVQDEKALMDSLRYHLAQTRLGASAPISADGSISSVNVKQWEDKTSSDPTQKLARTIFSHTAFTDDLISRSAFVADQHVFNTQIDFKTGPITHQKSSGRCWLFATTNVLRYEIMKKLNLEEFQLSQSYLFFWDKLNKANYYLELSIQLADEPFDSRVVSHLSQGLLNDGGQYDMAVNLLQTYGVVPQPAFPESYSSSNSAPLNKLLKTKLREHALVLRKLNASLRSSSLSEAEVVNTLRAKKEELMREVWTVMTANLGVPPGPHESFVWEYYDKDGKAHRWEGTPREFFKAYTSKQYPAVESFSLINDPRNAYSTLYTVEKLGNIWGGRPVLYVNTEMENLKNAVVTMVKAGQPVFFGCDSGQFTDKPTGIYDTALYDYEHAFNITLNLTKAERLLVKESAMTHAMVISGVHLDGNGKPLRYKVENSWGDGAGDKGYFVMTDRWFEQFVYQVVVPKALAPKALVKVFEDGNAVELPPWDPMGALA